MVIKFLKAICIILFTFCVCRLGAQDPCVNPPSTIQNSDMLGNAVGNLSSSNMSDWYISHGSPTIRNENSPGSTGSAIWMWSYTGGGEGIYTCFKFEAGVRYDISLWVKNTNAIDQGNLRVYACNSFSGGGIPNPSSYDLISSSFAHSNTWTELKYTFTASADFSRLLIYPFMASPPINGKQYELVIDKLIVNKNKTIGPVTLTGPNITLCEGDEYNLNAFLAGGGNPNYTFNWFEDDGSGFLLKESGSKQFVKHTAKKSTRWKVRVEDPNDSSAGFSEAFINITVKDGLNLYVGNDTSICHGDSANLFSIATRCLGDTNHLRFTWRDIRLGKIVGHSRSLRVFPDESTVYRITVEDTVKILSRSEELLVTVDRSFDVYARSDTSVCLGSEVILDADPFQCKNSQVYYRWEKEGVSGFITGKNPKVIINGETKYSLFAFNDYGLTDTSEVMIHINPSPNIEVKGNDSLCIGEQVGLEVNYTGGTGNQFSFEWTDPAGNMVDTSKRIEVASSKEGYYKVRVSDNCSWPVEDSLSIAFFPIPEAKFVMDTSNSCAPYRLQLYDSSLLHDSKFNLWLINSTSFIDSADLDTIWEKPGNYQLGLVVKSGRACNDTFYYPHKIDIHPKPHANLKLSTDLEEENISFNCKNLATGASHHYWYFGTLNLEEFNGTDTSLSFKDTGYQYVYQIAENIHGCLDTAIDSVRIVEQFIVFIPNAFSPNNDEHNPIFYPDIHGVKTYHLQIYNRWGERLIDCDNCTWDGKYRSKFVEQDVYFYVIQFEGEKQTIVTKKGSLTVLR